MNPQNTPRRPLNSANISSPGQIKTPDHLVQHLIQTGNKHKPYWIHDSVAGQLAQHIPSGMVIPHPGLTPTPQAPAPSPDQQPQQQPMLGMAGGGMVPEGGQPPTGLPEERFNLPQEPEMQERLSQIPRDFSRLGEGWSGWRPGEPFQFPIHPPPQFLGPPVRRMQGGGEVTDDKKKEQEAAAARARMAEQMVYRPPGMPTPGPAPTPMPAQSPAPSPVPAPTPQGFGRIQTLEYRRPLPDPRMIAPMQPIYQPQVPYKPIPETFGY